MQWLWNEGMWGALKLNEVKSMIELLAQTITSIIDKYFKQEWNYLYIFCS